MGLEVSLFHRTTRCLKLTEDGRITVGDRITLNTPAGDFEYTISGLYEDALYWCQ
ncbi:MAG: hypothetical protein SOV79_05285 [Eisenbergiella porci]|uniref:hypothetical protein n=1 Tax=Eisenbergiella porci TaxID=2652274 RepID=UPI002A7573D5|nr:hypothetical protein [Eisenbergiella porci]MDY2651997.1 hypothetical protein [Eisenbergiella porci]